MENKYKNGKIYKIVDNTNNNIYIGSTIQILEERLSKHKCKNSTCISRNIIENGDFEIILIKDYPCNSKEELEEEEQKYIDIYECINKNRAYTGLTRKEYDKERYEKNKDKKKEYDKKRYEKNKEYKKEKILCECGCMINRSGIARHRKSQKHIKKAICLI